MRREWICAIVLACAAGAVRADDAPAKPAKAETYQALRAEYSAAKKAFDAAAKKRSAEYQAALKDAGDDDEKKAEARKKLTEAARKNPSPLPAFAPRFLAVARANPDSKDAPAALDLALSLANPRAKGGVFGEVFAAVRDGGYLMRPELQAIARTLAETGDADALQFVRDAITKNPDRKTQFVAARALARHYESAARAGERLTTNETARAAAEKQLGKEKVEEMVAKAKEAKAQQEELASLMKEKYADLVPDLSVGSMAPEVVSVDLDGKEVKLSDLKGKVVVLDFWATWCPPCRAMIPHQKETVEKLKDKPFVLVSVSADAESDTLTDFLKTTPMPWTHWWNGARGGVLEDWSIRAFPTYYVLDATGKIRHTGVGGGKANEKKLDEIITKLVEEAEAAKK